MPRAHWAEPLYAAADLWIERCLKLGTSLIEPSSRVWVQEVADDFYERFVVNEDAGAGSFIDKLLGQVSGARRETVLLAAEILYLYYLPIEEMTHQTRVGAVSRVLGLLDDPPKLEPALDQAMTTGLARYGQAKTQPWRQTRYLAELARSWPRLERHEQARLLGDPWALKAFLGELTNLNPLEMSALQHIVFPEAFEPIVSVDVKAAIGRAFAGVAGVGDEEDVDRKLAVIRRALEPMLGERFHFYSAVVEPAWRAKPADAAWAFARFALKVRELENFDELEMDYKLELAGRLAAARNALLGDDPGWLTLLKQAFADPNNLTSWRQHASFLDWCEASAEAAGSALRALWGSSEPTDAARADFLERVPDDAIRTPGARANILSYLLGASDPDDWVIYKPTPADRALELWGQEQAETGDVLGRMQRFALLLDELRVRVTALGGPPTSRLEAQGMAWTVVEGTIPEAWSAEDRAALEEFRGGVDTTVAPDPEPKLPTHAWLVRGANVDGKDRVPAWIEEGFVAIGWSEMGELSTGMTLDELHAAARLAYPDESPGAWGAWAGNLFRFLSRMSVGDLVVTVSGDDAYVGRILSDVYNEPVLHAGRRRKVEWINPTAPFSRAEILKTYPSLHTRMRTRLTVTDLKDDVDAVQALIGMEVSTDASEFAGIPPASDELAKALFVPKPWIQSDILDLLARKRQLIFYGPPGTGKTYVAQRIAEHVARSGGDFDLVQFHPSYSYEDFFEGFRPSQAVGDAGVLYALRDGPLKRIAQLASVDPAHPYVLIVDEINRGNIPKIFGELLFLLEYRDRSINLQYSDEPFSLPPNLFVIGTMNTADRSIALVDAALRRRFYFVPFLPTEEPVRDVLRGWLGETGHGDLPALLLDELNKRIAKDEIAIGPSYFMNGDVSHDGLRRVWRHAILPLLDEHYYGTKVDVHAQLGFDACLAAVMTPQVAELANDKPVPGVVETPEDDSTAEPA